MHPAGRTLAVGPTQIRGPIAIDAGGIPLYVVPASRRTVIIKCIYFTICINNRLPLEQDEQIEMAMFNRTIFTSVFIYSFTKFKWLIF